MKKYIAEMIGTFTLVFFGCATVLFMVDQVGLLGVALAFGLAVVAMAYSIGHISGAHLNPAVSFGALIAGQINFRDFIGYTVAQVFGGLIAALVLLVIASGKVDGFDAAAGFATNGWSDYGMWSAFLFEVVATTIFLVVILGATQDGVTTGNEGLIIGLTLTMIHLAGIMVSGASVNPARSIGPALIEGGNAMNQLWLYIAAPLLGGLIGGLLHRSGITSRDE